ncbi:hypothetical protein [Neobacillus vireti]|uniref:Uncharacterized protein n=1 Tax=Neobacillus vireti LMG 21834 TaxID=1131730 RepID=A0AB94IUS1_9BACI|nr:hypothetical protein [Neobacillus vireti]ETI70801.1 hypothetical protein BAVI_00340 [Neobacillus vireti LMG 21834]KLT17658.1 hypothetical protein AA980_11100 [Neobacillus vireti]
MKAARVLIAILVVFLVFWLIYFLKTDDLFFKDAYFTKERAYQAWASNTKHSGMTSDFLKNAKKIETGDERVLMLAGENQIYQLRFQKDFFLWMLPSVDGIDNETIKHINEFDSEYYFSFNCVATVTTKSPKIDKVKIGKNDAELLPLGPYFKDAKDLNFWFYNTQPDAFDCQGPSGETFTFYDNNGKVITKVIDN